jgi:ATP-binding cassette, subfamily A (ABC1), member 3
VTTTPYPITEKLR